MQSIILTFAASRFTSKATSSLSMTTLNRSASFFDPPSSIPDDDEDGAVIGSSSPPSSFSVEVVMGSSGWAWVDARNDLIPLI